jgi:hypothetical protein
MSFFKNNITQELLMGRLTISLNDEMHFALKETATRQGRSIGSIIEEGLRLRGIKPMASAKALVGHARQQAQMSESEAVKLANEEVHAEREG